MCLLRRLLSAIEIFTDRAGKAIAFIVVGMTLMMMYEVISRFAFDKPTVWAYEAISMLFSIYVLLAGGYLVLRKKHIRIDILWARLSPRAKAIADLATSVFSFTYVVTLIWFAIPWAWRSFKIYEVTVSVMHPPVWPFKMLLVVGTFWVLLLLVVKLIRDIYTATKRSDISPEAIQQYEKGYIE